MNPINRPPPPLTDKAKKAAGAAKTFLQQFADGEITLPGIAADAAKLNQARVEEIQQSGIYGPNTVEMIGVSAEADNTVVAEVAQNLDGPLRQTVKEGILENEALKEGFRHLKDTAQSSGLNDALKQAGVEISALHGTQLKEFVGMAKGVGGDVVEKINTDPEFAKNFSVILAAAMSDGANEAGINADVARTIIKDAAELADKAIQSGKPVEFEAAAMGIAQFAGEALDARAPGATAVIQNLMENRGKGGAKSV